MKRFAYLFLVVLTVACGKDDGIKKESLALDYSTWKADNGNLTPRSDYFILNFYGNGEVDFGEANYSSSKECKWEYVFRNPLLGGEAYYDEATGRYTQKDKGITFNLTATGQKVYGFPDLGSHSITFKQGEIVGIANVSMDVIYEVTDEDGNVTKGSLKFAREKDN